MVVALHKGGRDIKEIDALAHVFGYAVGLDMTRRDRQDEAKAQKRPWEIAKSADLSAPVGPLYPVSSIGHPHKGAIKLNVNGIVKQDADLTDMIWSVAEQISILSTYFESKPGDLIFSGTPEGVSAVTRGDHMNVAIAGLGRIDLRVV
jgi:fumarylpyruvate hydrolase